jgi:hypothetical protein
MPRLSFDCEELLHWWEPKSDVSFIFDYNWRSLQQLREAITLFLSARLYEVSHRAAGAIAEMGCPRLKTMIASNPQTPPEMLEFLSEVSPLSVLIRVAENPNTGKATLSKLASHENADVRAAVADNAGTPESSFRRLVNDESVDVRYRIAENPHAPADSLYTLLKDENPYVNQRARLTLFRILSNTIALSTRRMAEESELQPDFQRHDFSTVLNQQLVEELSSICGSPAIESFAPELKF